MASKEKAGMAIKSFSISEALWSELLGHARKEEKSASVIIRDLIKGYLARTKRKEVKSHGVFKN